MHVKSNKHGIVIYTSVNLPEHSTYGGNTDWLSLLYAAGKSLSMFLLKMLISLGFWDNKHIWFSSKTSGHRFSFSFANCSLPFKTWSVLGLCLELHFFISFLHSLFFFKGFLSFLLFEHGGHSPSHGAWSYYFRRMGRKKDKKRQWRDSWKNQQMQSKLCVCVGTCGWVWAGAWNRCYLVDYKNHFMMYMYIKSWYCTSQISTNLT